MNWHTSMTNRQNGYNSCDGVSRQQFNKNLKEYCAYIDTMSVDEHFGFVSIPAGGPSCRHLHILTGLNHGVLDTASKGPLQVSDNNGV